MKSLLFLAIMSVAVIACDTPDNTTGTTTDGDTTVPMMTDTSMNTMRDTTLNRTDTLRN